MDKVSFEDFKKLDIRVGKILSAEPNTRAKKPAYILKIDFGEDIGIKTSSAQITERYVPEELVGRQIVAVVNFEPKQVADVMSEVLILGVYASGGVVLISPDSGAENGDKIG